MNYADALRYLDRHRNVEATEALGAGAPGDLDLSTITAILAALGDPHRSYPVIHVTGTNGKGSVTRFVADILGGLELAVGRYTSPHLHRINERICYDGNPISDDELARVLTLLSEIEPMIDVTPTWFEVITAAALVWFADQGVDVAVIEVGMLGRDDATNVVEADVAVITNIANDHVAPGPNWRREVTTAKAGIITPGRPVVCGFVPDDEVAQLLSAQEPSAVYSVGRDAVVESNLVAVGGRVVDYLGPYGPYESIFVPFHGAHQGTNLATALLTVETFLGRGIDGAVVNAVVETAELPGRFELLATEPTLIVDVAHNEAAATATWNTLDTEYARLGSWILVVGLNSDRDPHEFLRAIHAGEFDAVILTQPGGDRSLNVEALAAAAQGLDAEVVADPIDAIRRARVVAKSDDLILVTGSSRLVAPISASLSETAP